MAGETTQTQSSWRVAALLLLILILTAFLRWHTLTDRGFFFDEIWIVGLSNGHGSAFMDIPTDRLVTQPNSIALSTARPIWQVPGNITGAIHPPGTFVLLRLWREVFGDSMFAIRSFSASWSLLVVALIFVAGRQSFGTTAGLWAALLSALSLGNIDQAQDVRGYTLLQAELLLTLIVLLSARGKTTSWPRAIAIGIGTLAMMYTHYFAASACAAVTFGVLTLLRGRTRWQALVAIAAGGVIWVITWLPHLRAQMAFVPETADGFLKDMTAVPLLSTLSRLTAALFQSLVADPRTLHEITIVGGLVCFAVLALRIRLGAAEQKPVAAVWLAVIVCLLGALLTLDLFRQTAHLQHVKYLLLMNPAICVLLASGTLWRKWLIPAAATAALLLSLFVTPTPPKPDDRPQLAWLNLQIKPGDVVILPSFDPLGRDGQVMYLHLAYGVPHESHRIAIPVRTPPASFLDTLPADVSWFYYAFDSRYDPVRFLPGIEIVERGPSTSAAVYRVRPRTASTVPAASAPLP